MAEFRPMQQNPAGLDAPPMNGSIYRRVAVMIVALSWAAAAFAADRTTVKDFIIEPPTLISLGFEWRIDGDDNRNAIVSVSYRKKGEQAWKEGLPSSGSGTSASTRMRSST